MTVDLVWNEAPVLKIAKKPWWSKLLAAHNDRGDEERGLGHDAPVEPGRRGARARDGNETLGKEYCVSVKYIEGINYVPQIKRQNRRAFGPLNRHPHRQQYRCSYRQWNLCPCGLPFRQRQT